MFLLPSILLGVVLALLLGGRPSRVLDVRLRLTWAVASALGLQIVLFSGLRELVPEALRERLHLASYGLLVVFAAANVRVRTLLPVVGGMLLNALAILANGGSMPLSRSAAEAAGVPTEHASNVSADAERLRFLGDVFALPKELPLANAFSVGDILIGLGMAAFIVAVSLGESSERPLEPRRLVEPLRRRPYRLLAGGTFVSAVGDWLTLAAVVGWTYGETGSIGQVAVVMLTRLAPLILGGSLAAVVVDRFAKHRLLVWVELGRAAAVVGVVGGILAGQRLAVVGALAASGALAALSRAAVPALLPSLVPAGELAAANAGLGIAGNTAMALGAGGAGLALSLVGVTAALAADVATFAVSIALFAQLPATALAPRRAGGPSAVRYLVSHRTLLVLVLSFAVATVATGLTNASLPRVLGEHSDLGPAAYGFGLCALATGLAVGQTFVGFSRIGPSAGRWVGVALLSMSGLLALFALGHHAPTAFLLLGLIGFVDGTTDVVFDTVVQRDADSRYLGSVFGLASATTVTTMMGAVSLAPVLNGVLDARGVVMGAALVLLAAAGIALAGLGRSSRAPAAAAPVGSR